ncbi:lytic transglycosylase F [Alkalilimnicola ehrlichii]|uniref:Lytic transglycosylase F n=1 Tax=Alkalilimnicola ehrlichii TaxID=351052 RepID=A0A3E0WXA4_9GAMM|nr:membrane-bound lytic murein transglycosylase MltF [Alkalilimnicola ehrlichii]RFA29274.1 lytic transglycosylase F [Alkalilimnicola ehrlichii]RFA36791.1 lytic transglycosylase F [Alkalilimnicola ehrlichii]
MRRALPLLALVWLLLSACSPDASDTDSSAPEPTDPLAHRYVEKGDLPALKERGELRILVHRVADDYLPRAGYPLDVERQMVRRFAREQGLDPVLIPVSDFGDLLTELLAGHGDLVAANLTVTPVRAEQVAFTLGVDQTREVVVARSGEPSIASVNGLSGRRIGVKRGTSFWEFKEAYLGAVDGLEVVPLSATLTSDEILDGLLAGDYDFALQDSNVMEVVSHYRDDVQVVLTLGEGRPLAWAVRPDNTELLNALNRFLTRERLIRTDVRAHTDDLAGIKERKVLRVITRNNAATYYLYRGELVGFEYELARRLAEQLGVRLQMVVADDHESMIPMLLEGEGDLVAAFMTRTDARAEQVAFSRPYHYATETVVGRADEPDMVDVEALAGRTLHVRRTSSYWDTAKALQEQGIDLALEAVPSDMETEEIMARVAEGSYDLTIADSHILQSELTWRDDLKGLLTLGEPISHGWAMRPDNPELLAAVNAFWNREYRGLHYNILYRRYFEDQSRIQQQRAGRVDLADGSRLSPWDDLVRAYAERYGFDWRLIMAQMYQESRFDPDAVSWVGARGLMQVMPRTGAELGLQPLDDPEVSIHAGVKYMDWLRYRFPERLPVEEQMWFSLAAYNAGVGHVRDARRLADQKGWDPDQWFGNVEEAMLLLARPEYYRQARFGYVRGQEPVNYVRNIRDRYRAYARLTDE